MTKNKHFRKRLLVLLFTIALSMNGFVLYAKNAEEPDNQTKSAVSTELPASTVKRPRSPRQKNRPAQPGPTQIFKRLQNLQKKTRHRTKPLQPFPVLPKLRLHTQMRTTM